MSPKRSTGVCTSGAPDRTPFHANHSYGYALRSKGAPSNTPDAHPSGIFMQLPGYAPRRGSPQGGELSIPALGIYLFPLII